MLRHLKSSEKLALLEISLASLCFGFLGIFGKFAFQADMSVGTLLTGRFSLAATLLGLYLILFKPQSLKIGWPQFAIATLQGLFGYAVFSTLYFKAVEGISVSLAAMLLFTYPLWIAVIQFIRGAVLNRKNASILAIAFFGLVILLWGQIEVHSVKSFVFGFASGLTYAIYIYVSSRWQQQVNPLASSFYVILWAAIALALFHQPQDSSWRNVFMNLTPTQAWLILGMSIVTTILPLTLVLASLQKLPSTYVALVSMLEPVTAAIAGWILLNEALSWHQLIGSIIVLTAVLFQIKEKPNFETQSSK